MNVREYSVVTATTGESGKLGLAEMDGAGDTLGEEDGVAVVGAKVVTSGTKRVGPSPPSEPPVGTSTGGLAVGTLVGFSVGVPSTGSGVGGF
jgi:hypothetical protein